MAAERETCAGGGPSLPAGSYDEATVTRGAPRRSKMGRRRAWVLVLVHVVIFAHILAWKLGGEGETLSPVEPSETMYSLATGAVNAGAVLLLLSILSVLVLGRFFCGWACHLVALQDASAWMLKKVGLRPRPLRSRALIFVPLGAGLFMFGMPLAVRLWNGLGPPEWHLELTKSDFWATFPGPWIGGLTFLVSGFVMIWLLGSKGFCTYACPYGGLFGVADLVAPGRIRVTDACKACGHCSAVCTSNVAVADEVHRYGAVVDPGCMKCMDCVSSCPEGALHYGFGKPAFMTRAKGGAKGAPKRGARLLWVEEGTLVLVFALTLAIFAGLPEAVVPWASSLHGVMPLLFSLGLASTTAFVALFVVKALRRRDLSLQSWTLRREGSLTRAGRVFVGCSALWLAFVFYCGLFQWRMWSAERALGTVDVDALAARAPGAELSPAAREGIERARRRLEAAEALRIFPDIRPRSRLAGLAVAEGDLGSAVEHFRRAAEIDPGFAPTHFELGLVLLRTGRREEARESLRAAVAADPELVEPRRALVQMAAAEGDLAGAVEEARGLLPLVERRAQLLVEIANLEVRLRRPEAAIAGYERALALDAENAEAWMGLGSTLLFDRKDPEAAVPALRRAVEFAPLDLVKRRRLREALGALGRKEEIARDREETLDALRAGVEGDPGNQALAFALAAELYAQERDREALERIDRIIEATGERLETLDLKIRCLERLGMSAELEAARERLRRLTDR